MKRIDVNDIQERGSFAVILKCLLAKKNISQGELASAVGISQATVTHYIKGLYTPSQKILGRIAEYLEVPPNTFYDDIENYTPYLNMSSNNFSSKLYSLIKNKHITCETFAKEVGVSRQTISNYLNEKQMPNSTIAKKMADYFDVTTDYLLSSDKIEVKDRPMKICVTSFPQTKSDCIFSEEVELISDSEPDENKTGTCCRLSGGDCKLNNGICPYIEKK